MNLIPISGALIDRHRHLPARRSLRAEAIIMPRSGTARLRVVPTAAPVEVSLVFSRAYSSQAPIALNTALIAVYEGVQRNDCHAVGEYLDVVA